MNGNYGPPRCTVPRSEGLVSRRDVLLGVGAGILAGLLMLPERHNEPGSSPKGSVNQSTVPVDPPELAPQIPPQELSATWLSGASGDGVIDGSFGEWRGSEIQVAGAWQMHPEEAFGPGREFADWKKPVDFGWGAFMWRGLGDTWRRAAEGGLDDRWKADLAQLHELRNGLTTFVRPAYEFNGSWMEHYYVNPDEAALFIQAWKRMRAIQQEVCPEAKLVWCPGNSGTMDAVTAWPGGENVDIVGFDFYNQYPWVNDEKAFEEVMNARMPNGNPKGPEIWRQWAETEGRCIGIGEWGSNSELHAEGNPGGDAPVFIKAFNGWMNQHAGSGPGGFYYDVYFNVGEHGGGRFLIYPEAQTRMPKSAEMYRSLTWGIAD